MNCTNPILEEKCRVQKMLSEEAEDMRDYTKRTHEDVRLYFEAQGWKPNYQPCEIRKTFK